MATINVNRQGFITGTASGISFAHARQNANSSGVEDGVSATQKFIQYFSRRKLTKPKNSSSNTDERTVLDFSERNGNIV